MAEDIVPGLIAQITAEFRQLYGSSKSIPGLLQKLQDGTATYDEAHAYAIEVSKLTGAAYSKYVSGDTLPDGRMYYNIASRLLPSTLDENYALVSDYAVGAQKCVNQAAGVGLNAVKPGINQDRVDGLVKLACGAEQYEDVAGQVLGHIGTFGARTVDETIKANAEFQAGAGLQAVITRMAEPGACKWCMSLAGSYEYPGTPEDVFRRHDNCRCVVTYQCGKKRQNVWSKAIWEEDREAVETRMKIHLPDDRDPAKIEARKVIRRPSDTFRVAQYENAVRKHVNVDSDAVLETARGGGRNAGVVRESESKTKAQLQKSIRSRSAQVELHADKIQNPSAYAERWESMNEQERQGLLRKWEKDMRRNAAQVEIEMKIWKERF